ncbi:hypothetical protein ACRS5S_12065 [Nocardia asiatica]|uniref:hypothetical protein n=1 Tax=Nocardia asiatica TaxID=209252 RepID=UPI003EE051EC
MPGRTSPSAPAMVHNWFGVIGAIVAPTTIITALCYYFGYVYTRKRLAYFGVDCDALGFTSSDYVLSSVSVLYAPLLLLLVGWFAAVWTGVYTRRFIRSGRRPRLVRSTARACLTLGAVLIVMGVAAAAAPQRVPDRAVAAWTFSPAALAVGGLLVVGGSWVLSPSTTEPDGRASTTRASRLLAVAVSLLALFALMNAFASRLGEDAAQIEAHNLWVKESVVSVLTEDRLDVPRNLVAETLVVTQQGKPPAFRYQCFRSIVARGDLWVLVPAKWSPENGYAVIVPADSSIVSVSRSKRVREFAEDHPDTQKVAWECPERAAYR